MVDRLRFGTLPDGREVPLFRLRAADGVTMEVLGYGGVVRSLRVPDREGALADVVLGYEDLEGYLADRCFLGGLIGRYAGRIRDARFTLDGRTHALEANEGPHQLHGASHGFHRRLWDAEPFASAAGVGVHLRLQDDEAGGYPGRLEVSVTYMLTDAAEWTIDYVAITDRPTVLNLTQHSYFDLSGLRRGVGGHRLAIDADVYAVAGDGPLPTGELAPVEGTPLDFREATPIGARLDDGALAPFRGYDHDFIVRRAQPGLARAARGLEPGSGRTLEVRTTEPAIHLYSGQFLDRPFASRQGFCLEAQHLPDSPNRPEFPSTVLRPGQQFRSRTVFAFGTDRG